MSLKKQRLHVFIALGILGLVWPWGAMAQVWRLEMQDNQKPMAITVADKLLRLDGLPIGGQYYYDAKQSVFYAQTPVTGAAWWRVAPFIDMPYARVAEAQKVGDGPPLAGFPTVQWRISVGGQMCAEVFASTAAAKKFGFGYTALARMNLGFSKLRAVKAVENPCIAFEFPPALEDLVGLPLKIVTHDGVTEVTAIRTLNQEDAPTLPEEAKQAQPVTDDAQKIFLQNELPPDVAKGYEQTRQQLPPELQKRVLQELRRQQERKQ